MEVTVVGYRVDVMPEGGYLVGAARSDGSMVTVRASSALADALRFIREKLSPALQDACDMKAGCEQSAIETLAKGAAPRPAWPPAHCKRLDGAGLAPCFACDTCRIGC